MGYSIGDHNGRDIGYGVPAVCDFPNCGEQIDRGTSYVCGGEPYGGEHGCGLFFCAAHRYTAGRRRNYAPLCSHCWDGKGKRFTPTPDVEEWVAHKLTDKSWADWRKDNPQWVSDHAPKCAVRGVMARGAMCLHVVIGGKTCSYSGTCEHKRTSLAS